MHRGFQVRVFLACSVLSTHARCHTFFGLQFVLKVCLMWARLNPILTLQFLHCCCSCCGFVVLCLFFHGFKGRYSEPWLLPLNIFLCSLGCISLSMLIATLQTPFKSPPGVRTSLWAHLPGVGHNSASPALPRPCRCVCLRSGVSCEIIDGSPWLML